MSGRGFTLIEILVALAIVAVALLASLRAIGVMSQSGTELNMHLFAQLSARNQIAVLRASKAFPPARSAKAIPRLAAPAIPPRSAPSRC